MRDRKDKGSLSSNKTRITRPMCRSLCLLVGCLGQRNIVGATFRACSMDNFAIRTRGITSNARTIVITITAIARGLTGRIRPVLASCPHYSQVIHRAGLVMRLSVWRKMLANRTYRLVLLSVSQHGWFGIFWVGGRDLFGESLLGRG